jgi:hypothetical protein
LCELPAVGKYSQAPFYGTLIGIVLRMVLGRQWIARIASVLMTARFAAVNTGKRRSVAGIIQLIKRCEIEFANKPDVFVYGHIILLSKLVIKQFPRRRY